MNTIGIITEYNPFHNGHRYQIETIKARTGAQNIIIVMSGDFVQRGTPAWTDKYLRTQMALSCGADMVFELPVSFATASAEAFARAGVSILTSLGFVDGICFGSECDNLPLLQEIADFLATPPASFEETIHTLTASGISYPAARAQALNDHFKDSCQNYPTFFSEPNNILALEYLKAIRQSDSHLTPFLIHRKDSGYHSETLDTPLASATAIRKMSLSANVHIRQLLNAESMTTSHIDTTTPQISKEVFLRTIASVVPKEVLHILAENTTRYPITENDFSTLLYYRLTHLKESDTTILDMTEDILYRIQKLLPDFTTFSDFTAKLKTKQYTYSRISRVLLHSLLDIREFSADSITLPYVPYARLLGFRKEKSALLRHKTAIPVITKPADGTSQIKEFYTNVINLLLQDNTTDNDLIQNNMLSFHLKENTASSSFSTIIENYLSHACALYEKDISASNLYRQVQNMTLGCNRSNEYRMQPLRI